MGDLLDPSLLEGLTEEERKEALAAAAAAKRAEERAEQKALERAMKQREIQRKQENLEERSSKSQQLPHAYQKRQDQQLKQAKNSTNPKITFLSKRQRQQQQQQESTEAATASTSTTAEKNHKKASTITNGHQSTKTISPKFSDQHHRRISNNSNNNTSSTYSSSTWTAKEREVIRKTYLGTSSAAAGGGGGQNTAARSSESNSKNNNNKRKKSSTVRSKKATFRFEWDNTDDTLDDRDPLYASSTAMVNVRSKKAKTTRQHDDNEGMRNAQSVLNKPLEKMTTRDWRIFRENYEIVVKGGRAPPPLRSFREANLNRALLDAIENVMFYKQPTPIQRQTIPIGLQRRDLIGVAETGSGKTCAFGVPLLHYIMSLPKFILSRVAEDGPLALVMAPTRELAIQIHHEFEKLTSRQSYIKTSVIVGGQSMQYQAQELRDGVHVVVGTPGRMNDCIEMAYLVLNQCCYIVLDEADRMIDMGFAPQMESILDAMGGQLKSENEQEAYHQEEQDLTTTKNGLPRHRVTAMFSATMPLEVERIAKRYLRHPAVISIGDQDSGKNARIVQRVIFLSSPNKKESALRDLILNPRYLREKVIVFVNEKKHADGIGRMVERTGRSCVVLHGGKSQDQREESLEAFRRGGVVLVATDVAGRGLDIPDVAHVINYDLPQRSIDNYSHRIGRTGRAGKEGLATSLMTDEDEGIMAPLKAYLQSTGNPVPDKLARHPAASATTQGNVIY